MDAVLTDARETAAAAGAPEKTTAGDPVTEDRIIIAHTRAWFQATPWNATKFACERLIPRLEGAGILAGMPIADAEGYARWVEKSRKHVHRVLDGENSFPITWKWVWIHALDEPYRTTVMKELQALAGSLYVPLPHAGQQGDRMPCPTAFPQLMQEVSEAMAASRPAQDGMIDTRDCPVETRAYADQLVDVVEKALEELNNIARGTGVISRRELLEILNRADDAIR